jgi:hypothetical protein
LEITLGFLVPYGDEVTTGDFGSALSCMFRVILKDLSISKNQFLILLRRYILKTETISSNSEDAGTVLCINSERELLNSSISFKVFLKSLMILNIKEAKITIILTDESGIESVHSEVIFLGKELSILSKPDLKITNQDMILKSIFDSIITARMINTHKFNELLVRYFKEKYTSPNVKDVASVRTNCKKDFFRKTMTWKTFIRGLIFLRMVKFTMLWELTHTNNRVTTHAQEVIIS